MRSTITFAIVTLTGVVAGAQTARPTNPMFDIQLFYPSPGIHSFYSAESGDINHHLGFSTGINFNYAREPLGIYFANGDPVGTVIENRLDINVMGAIGFFDYAEIGFVFPLVAQGGFNSAGINAAGLNIASFGLPADFTQGDLRLIPKIRPWSYDDGLFAFSLIPVVVLPTGGGADYASERNVTFLPTVAVSSKVDPFRVALNVGYLFRDTPTELEAVGIVVKDEVFAKVAAGFNFNFLAEMPIEIIAELYGHTPAKNGFGLGTEDPLKKQMQQARTAIEADIGLRIELMDSMLISVGGGGGLTPGYGSPAPRIFAGFTYFSKDMGPADTDNDGIIDELDKCPKRKEDVDNFEDEDGCPEFDNDRDTVLDEDDQCPLEPEDRDGFRDEDGCPDPDNDEDTILDGVDQCPLDAEDLDGYQDEDGCPDLDNDNDGIADVVDKCPIDDPEDFDGFEDFDGCAELDNDKDGLSDLGDLCPNFAEDFDGVVDDDGCPEDNDGDGIMDADDKCPNEAETYNGIDDEDGCPEKLEAKSLVEVTEEKIVIKEKVFFKSGKAIIQKKSFNLLDQVAAVLKNYKHITKIRIEGHTDSRGSVEKNTQLSLERAEAVRDYLLGKGIAAERLVAEGVGPERPIASNRTKRGREENRRVEFMILEQKQIGVDVAEAAGAGGEIEMNLDAGVPGGAAVEEDAPADGGGIGGALFEVGPEKGGEAEEGGAADEGGAFEAAPAEAAPEDELKAKKKKKKKGRRGKKKPKKDDEIEFNF